MHPFLRIAPGHVGALAALALGALALTSCGGAATDPDAPAGPRLVLVSAHDQEADVGTTLPIVVRIMAPDGRPVKGTVITFTVTGGGGTVSPASVESDSTGQARASWTLGAVEGMNGVTVAASGAAPSSVSITATGHWPAFIAASITAGAYHSCGITAAHEAYCWGDNSKGQLGDSTVDASYIPVEVTGDHEFVQITAGQDHTCALDTSGAAFCWGGNSFGQLGIGIRDSVEIPTPVAGGLKFTALSTSSVHTCGLTAQGAAYCWGGNQFRQLGTGSGTWAWAPVPVAGNYAFRQVVAGWRHTCGITSTGATLCWGWNEFGALGDSTTVTRDVPTAVHTALVFRTLSAGFDDTCGITDDLHGYCWGDNNAGGGGTGTLGDTLLVPTPIAGSYAFTQLTSGYEYTCGVTSGGSLLCWGGNSSATLGIGDASNTPTVLPTPVALSGVSFSAVTGSMMHTCAIASTGVTYCWGLNLYGEVGDGTAQIRGAPVRTRAR